MKTTIEHKTKMEVEAHFDGKVLKTHGCKLGDFWGYDTCKRIDITREIEEVGLPKGKYKITIVFEKIDE